MEIITTVKGMQAESKRLQQLGKTIGFVPTMGALHEGHLSLIQAARNGNDLVVISVFVNPLQFAPEEDYETYPRNLEGDKILAKNAGVDIFFAPSVSEMYHEIQYTFVDVQRLTNELCGAHRQGHFKGVTTVITKLFNIVKPDMVYFGQKDYQQSQVIKKMIKDLNFNIKIVVMPTVREKDGLAISSRNRSLNPNERKSALSLYKSLNRAKELLPNERHSAKIIKEMRRIIEESPLTEIEYISICNSITLQSIPYIEGEVLIAIAVRIGKTRLIDNMLWINPL